MNSVPLIVVMSISTSSLSALICMRMSRRRGTGFPEGSLRVAVKGSPSHVSSHWLDTVGIYESLSLGLLELSEQILNYEILMDLKWGQNSLIPTLL